MLRSFREEEESTKAVAAMGLSAPAPIKPIQLMARQKRIHRLASFIQLDPSSQSQGLGAFVIWEVWRLAAKIAISKKETTKPCYVQGRKLTQLLDLMPE